MAKISNGIFGPISGKLGPVVGAIWKGIPYLRIRPKKSGVKKRRTTAQIANQQKFKFVSEWLVPFHPFINIGFQNLAKTKSEINLAFSENYHRAVTGSYPDLSIDYSKVRLSKGNLPGLMNPQACLTAPDTIKITWERPLDNYANYNDQIMLLVYSPALQMADEFIGGIIRDDKECTFRFNQRLAGKSLKVYASVTSQNRKKIADSQYLGEIPPIPL